MEDDAGLARLLQKALERPATRSPWRATALKDWPSMHKGSFDVIAVDQKHARPRWARSDPYPGLAWPPPAVIMITGSGNEQIAVRSHENWRTRLRRQGRGRGYLRLLPSVIEQVIRQHRLAEDKRRADEALQQRNRELTMLKPDEPGAHGNAQRGSGARHIAK